MHIFHSKHLPRYFIGDDKTSGIGISFQTHRQNHGTTDGQTDLEVEIDIQI